MIRNRVIGALLAAALVLCCPSVAWAEGITNGAEGDATSQADQTTQTNQSTQTNQGSQAGQAGAGTDSAGDPDAVLQATSNNPTFNIDDFDAKVIDSSASPLPTVTLMHYKGTDTDLSVPATVVIGDTEYQVAISGPVFAENTTLESVVFEYEMNPDGTYKSQVKLTNGQGLFSNCSNLKKADVSGLATNGCTDMRGMFALCTSLQSLDVSKWDTKDCTTMWGMFGGCASIESLDVSKWDTGSCTNMGSMFSYCINLRNLDVTNWNTSKLQTIGFAFACLPESLELDLRNWDLSSMLQEGWESAFFQGPKALLNDGELGTLSDDYPADGKYLAFGCYGDYGAILDNHLDRIWCLNKEKPGPKKDLYTLMKTPFDQISSLDSVTCIHDETTWKKIVAAIAFFENNLEDDEQLALQGTIWHYADNTPASVSAKEAEDLFEPGRQERIVKRIGEMIDYVDKNFEMVDFSNVIVYYYVPDDNTLQNMLSIETVKTVKFKPGKGVGSMLKKSEDPPVENTLAGDPASTYTPPNRATVEPASALPASGDGISALIIIAFGSVAIGALVSAIAVRRKMSAL